MPEEGDAGSYTALVTTRVTDEKCLGSEDQFVEKDFVVLEENPLNACYTELNDLELSSSNVKAGHDLVIEFNKITNFQENIANEVIVPVETFVNVELHSSLNEIGLDRLNIKPVILILNHEKLTRPLIGHDTRDLHSGIINCCFSELEKTGQRTALD
jgi:hypothetical protein